MKNFTTLLFILSFPLSIAAQSQQAFPNNPDPSISPLIYLIMVAGGIIVTFINRFFDKKAQSHADRAETAMLKARQYHDAILSENNELLRLKSVVKMTKVD